MKYAYPLVVLAAIVSGARAQHEDHAHHHEEPASTADAHIVVTINPEARVSAVLGAPLPAPPVCGTAMELRLKIVNQGFVTAPLRASIVGDGARLVELHMDGAKLSG